VKFKTPKRLNPKRDSLEPAIERRAKVYKTSREWTKEWRSIGDIPWDEIDWKRRKECKKDFKTFCKVYHPQVFYRPWSKNQLTAANRIERVINEGGMFAIAMERGGGKTALCTAGLEYAIFYGLRFFAYMINSNAELAESNLQSIKTDIETNPLFIQDFPEICYPILKCEGRWQALNGATYNEQPIRCIWSTDEIVLPVLMLEKGEHPFPPGDLMKGRDGSFCLRSANARIKTVGITGRVRGSNFKHPITGALIRPDLCLVDDVQSDQGAESPTTVRRLVKHIDGAIRNLSSGDRMIASVMPCTVIAEGDVSDIYLNPALKPHWNGKRLGLVHKWPEGITDNEINDTSETGKHWLTYEEARRHSLAAHGDIRGATEYYITHREIMDKGFILSDDNLYIKDESAKGNVEVSAIQHAMNLRFENPETFLAEMQNRPQAETLSTVTICRSDDLIRKTRPFLSRRTVPNEAKILTTFIDVQDEYLIYSTFACKHDYTGWFIDYGVFPDVSYKYVWKSQMNAWKKLSTLFFLDHPQVKPKGRVHTDNIKAPLEPKIVHAIDKLLTRLLNNPYLNEDGEEVPYNRIGIDVRWGDISNTVKTLIRDKKDRRILACSGQYIGATNKTMEEWSKDNKSAYETMLHRSVQESRWCLRPDKNIGMPYFLMDTNQWKTFLHQRLMTPLGSSGCVALFDADITTHEMFATHVCNSEYVEEVSARGRVVYEWKEKDKQDNEFLDCAYGCMALASLSGASLDPRHSQSKNTITSRPNKRVATKKKSLSELYKEKKGQ
jgi:hypothetical protein